MNDTPSIIIPQVIPPVANLPNYPSAGVGSLGNTENPVNVTNAGYLRVDSFSAALLNNNTAIIAVSAQNPDLLSQPLITDDSIFGETELARRESSRVYISCANFDPCSVSPSNVDSAKVVACDSVLQTITLQVSENSLVEITQNQYQAMWCLDGMLSGKQFQIESTSNTNIVCKFYNSRYTDLPLGIYFNYVVFGTPAPTAYTPSINPLPYIEYNGFAIPSVNPQIVSNTASFASPTINIVASDTAIVGSPYYLTFLGGNFSVLTSPTGVTRVKVNWGDGGSGIYDGSGEGTTDYFYESVGQYILSIDVTDGDGNVIYEGFYKQLVYASVDGSILPSGSAPIANTTPIEIPYVYVVCQAPVNGTYQLFFSAFRADNDELFLWKQLTFNGENRNPRIQTDSIGNLHIVWESDRCGSKNGFGVYYGVLGPGSRGLANEAFISALDKQSQSENLITSVLFSDSLLVISNPVALDLRNEDEYGAKTGSMWQSYTSGGSVNVMDAGTISMSGNPSSQEFSAFAILSQDQNGTPFDGKFSQLSYQLAFKFKMTTSGAVLSEDDIQNDYTAFKNQFSPVSNTASGVNVYSKSGKLYTISRYTKFDGGLIPISGSYELNGYSPSYNSPLKHYMLCAVPEKVSFEATNISDPTDVVGQILYTGKFKLSLILATAANLSDEANAVQSQHAIRDFGEFYIGTVYDFKIAIHYGHLHTEQVNQRASMYTINGTSQNVLFTGNIIVAVNNIVQVAENFTPMFGDSYYSFDIGLGAIPGGHVPVRSTLPFSQNSFENQSVTLSYYSIAIGPHTMVADPFLTHMAKFDRNVSRMVIKNTVGENNSRTAFDEAFMDEDSYFLSYGQADNKITLTQIPITFSGRNTSPSICVDNCDIVHISYQSNRNNNWQIYYTSSVDIDIPFRFDTQITNTPSNSLNPTVAVDQIGRRLIAWQDDRNGAFQIYAARSNRNIGCYNGANGIADTEALATNIFDPYDPYDPYGSNICSANFTFTNETNTSGYFHFTLSFYCDKEMSRLKTQVSSGTNIANWQSNGQQFPYQGVLLGAGESANITYTPSKIDDVSGSVYYLHILSDTINGSTVWPYVYAYYCPVEQSEECTVPCVYTNSTGSSKTAHFRVSFYSDSEYTNLVMSADSSISQDRWVASAITFPTAGINIPANDTASVFYLPNILTPEIYNEQDQTVADSLICGVNYFVKTESLISSVYSTLDTFSFECPCEGIKTQIGITDVDSQTWLCSGQGNDDTRITNTASDAIFPSAIGSRDGIVYISWEDYRESDTTSSAKELSPDIFFAVWNANNDTFSSSAQGSYDTRLTPYNISVKTRYYRPLSLIGKFQNPTFFFNTRNDVFRESVSLSKPSIDGVVESPRGGGVFTANFDVPITNADVSTCLNMGLVQDDVVDLFYANSDLPIPLVNQCIVRFDITGPAGCYAVRLRNENETNWSDWLSIIPELPDYPPINQSTVTDGQGDSFRAVYRNRGDGSMRNRFESFFIGNNRFITPWILSAGSGNKTVYAEILTYMGKTPELSINIVARYNELQYKVEFFSKSDFSIPVPQFNGYPVISTNALEPAADSSGSSSSVTSNVLVPTDVSSIDRNLVDVDTIYVKVTFYDPKKLNSILSLVSVQKFANLFAPGTSPNLTFNVLQQGANAQYGLPLTVIASGVYSGSFAVTKSDGVYNKDGLAVVVVNVPDPSTKVFTPQFSFDSLDIYNVNLPNLGDFEGPYSIVPRETPENIKDRQREGVTARIITMQEFKYKYNKNEFCTLMSNSCVSGSGPEDGFDDEVTPPLEYNSGPGGGPGGGSGPLTCASFDWTAYDAKEPFYYLDNSNISLNSNPPIWIRYSPSLFIDFSDPRASVLSFGNTTESTGVLIMLKVGDTISYTGGTTSGDPLIFTLPDNVIILENTSGYFCGEATPYRNATTAKTFNSGINTATIPSGSPSNNETVGIIDVFGAPVYDYVSGWYVRTFAGGISRTILQSWGFINSSGIFGAKFAFISSGIGHCYIRGCSCNADCN